MGWDGMGWDGFGREWDGGGIEWRWYWKRMGRDYIKYQLHKIKYILLGPVMFGSSARKTRLLSSTPYSSALRYTIHLLITT